MGGPSSFIKSLEAIGHGRAKERTMKIKLNQDWTGAQDGIHVITCPAGTEQEFPESIAAVLLRDGRAGLPGEAKAIAGAPENKMVPGPRANKASPGRPAKPKAPKAGA